MKKHALFGSPSGLYALEQCPGKIAFSKELPDVPESEFSKEGTVFHDLMERAAAIRLEGKSIKEILKKVPKEYEDMAEHIVDACEKLNVLWNNFREKHGRCTKHFELKVKIDEDTFGTSDVVFVGINVKTGKTDVVAVDWKYGRGVEVKAEENLQGIAYLLGAIKTLEITNVGVCLVIIAQVRLDSKWPEHRFVFKGDEIQGYYKKIRLIVDKAKDMYDGKIPVEIKAGSHCRFCKAAYWAKCPEQKRVGFDELAITAAELPVDMPNFVKSLSLDEQVKVFLKKSMIEDFLDAVAVNLKAAFETGITHPELKLIKTNGRRGWKYEDDEKTAKALIKKGVKKPWKKKLIGLGEAEKLAKKPIDDLVKVSEGRVELVRADDKRDGLMISEPSELD